MLAPLSTTSPAQARHSLVYNLAGITLLVMLAAVGLAYLIDRTSHAADAIGPALSDRDTVQQTVAGRELDIPSAWFRYGEQMRSGFASQVDLQFMLQLEPAATPFPVGVTLLPRNRARSSSALLDTVYLHQFGEGTTGGIPGLVGKSLIERDGYAGETVWYDPLSPAPFVAKCAAAVSPGQPDQCLRTIHLQSGLAAVLSFDASALPLWREFDRELALWLGQIGAV